MVRVTSVNGKRNMLIFREDWQSLVFCAFEVFFVCQVNTDRVTGDIDKYTVIMIN